MAKVALAVIGLVPAAISGCISVCEFWMRAEGTGKDFAIFKIRLDLQAARLKTWKMEWGMDKSDEVMKTHPLFKMYAPLAVRYPYLIHFVLRDLQNVEGDLKLQSDQTSNKRIMQVVDFDATEEWIGAMTAAFEATNQRTGLRGRMRWALNTPRAARKSLVVLKELVDDLTNFFRAPESLDLAPTVLGTILPSNDQELVKEMGTYTESKKPGDVVQNTEGEVNEDLNEDEMQMSALAWIKGAVSAISDRVARVEPGSVLPMTQLRNNRGTGQFRGGEVFVEWKTIPSLRRSADAPIFEKRIKDVAYLLRSDRKPSQFRTLDCVGLVREIKPDYTKFGLVCRMESSKCFSLRDLLAAADRQVALGNRYSAAKALAKAILYLHLASWLHKAIRSDNVVYFASAVEAVDFGWPFLVGFDMSRPSSDNELTEIPRGELRYNIYRHPRVQGLPLDVEDKPEGDGSQAEQLPGSRDQFSVLHDLYSFGVVLLELAYGRTVEDRCREEKADLLKGDFNSGQMKNWLVEEKVPGLDVGVGVHYREATQLCLTGDFDVAERSLQTAFYLDVVRRLEKCSA
jgi:Prion-inhibition and propagation